MGNRPTLLRWGGIGLVLFGSSLTLPPIAWGTHSGNVTGGIMGIAAGVTYALYTVLAQKSLQTLHPIPFTWLSFATTLVLSAGCLLFWDLQDSQLPWLALWIGGFLSAIATSGGHILNNFGIRLIGATSASMIGASSPALTVVLAWLVIQERLNSLQILGVVIVTLSVALLSWDHRFFSHRTQH